MKTNIFLAVVSALAISVAASAQTAQTNSTPAASSTPASSNKANWDKNHPRRAEVNQRLKNQNARVDKKVDNGTMSKTEANKIHKEDHAIRKEEKADAATNNGHITKQEQKQINRQENHVSKQIKKH